MWIHRDLRVAFIAHPRTGSREVGYEILARRGFTRLCGHHGVPWATEVDTLVRMKNPDLRWWWEQNPWEWTFYAGVRNPFEVFHSIGRAALGGKTPTPARFEEYLWKHWALYRSSSILFPGFWEVPGCRALRFDQLRDDVVAMLAEHALPPLQDGEGRRESSIHHTRTKPPGEHYTAYLTTVCRRWIEERYAAELEAWAYRWESPQYSDPGG